jgi:hypothetical protein
MADIKTQYFNKLIMYLIFDKCGLSHTTQLLFPPRKKY